MSIFSRPLFLAKTPNYKVIELEAKNENLKDKLIAHLETRVKELEYELRVYQDRSSRISAEQDVGSNMIDSRNAINEPHGRPVIRTMSEAALYLEKRSLNALSLKELPNEKS